MLRDRGRDSLCWITSAADRLRGYIHPYLGAPIAIVCTSTGSVALLANYGAMLVFPEHEQHTRSACRAPRSPTIDTSLANMLSGRPR